MGTHGDQVCLENDPLFLARRKDGGRSTGKCASASKKKKKRTVDGCFDFSLQELLDQGKLSPGLPLCDFSPGKKCFRNLRAIQVPTMEAGTQRGLPDAPGSPGDPVSYLPGSCRHPGHTEEPRFYKISLDASV